MKLGKIYHRDIVHGDCLDVLSEHPDNFFDSVVCDPPYGLEFMGKKWDRLWNRGGDAFSEDKGWGMRPAGYKPHKGIVWCVRVPTGAFVAVRNGKYFPTGNSGFPKSQDIGKAIDKAAGAKRKVMSEYVARGFSDRTSANKGDQWGSDVGKVTDKKGERTIPATLEAQQWDGWGTALKPAHENICVARKPLSESTVAANVLKHGTGGINISKNRIKSISGIHQQSVLTHEVLSNVFDGIGLSSPDSFSGILSLSLEQCHDFCSSIFSVLDSYSIAYKDLLHNLVSQYRNLCKLSVDVPYDCDRQVSRVMLYGKSCLKSPNSKYDYPTLSRFYDALLQTSKVVSPSVFPSPTDVLECISHSLNLQENTQWVGSSPPLFCVWVFAYCLHESIRHHINLPDSKNQGRWPANLILQHHDDCVQVGTKKVKTGTTNSREGTGLFAFGDHDKKTNPWVGEDGKEELIAWDCHPDCPVRLLDEQSGIRPSGGGITKQASPRPTSKIYDGGHTRQNWEGHNDTGGASRFFYQAKASPKERYFVCQQCNTVDNDRKAHKTLGWNAKTDGPDPHVQSIIFHPTQKPVELIRYLVRLVTPPNGYVLDPFFGSGTLGVAAKAEGFNYLGIDQDPDYCRIARYRVRLK